MIIRAMAEETLPIYGDGGNVRDWLFVDDHARALQLVFEGGVPGETYNVGGSAERRNIDVAREICRVLDEVRPRARGEYEELITFVADRPGHDRRYAIDAAKISTQLAWSPSETFESGIAKMVRWYVANEDWWRPFVEDRAATQWRGVPA